MRLTFDTDAALKSAIARDCPNVAIRKELEWNEWHLKMKGADDRADWLDTTGTAMIDCAHDKADQREAREAAYSEAVLIQRRYDAITRKIASL